MFYKKRVLKNFAKFIGKYLCRSLFINKQACNFIKNEAPAQVFSSEFCEIFKNTFLQSIFVRGAFHGEVFFLTQTGDPSNDFLTIQNITNIRLHYSGDLIWYNWLIQLPIQQF